MSDAKSKLTLIPARKVHGPKEPPAEPWGGNPRNFMDILDIKLQKEVALKYEARTILEERITAAKQRGDFVLPIIVCARWPMGNWTLLVNDRKIRALDRLIMECPHDSIKSKHVDFGDLLCDMMYNQEAYRYVLGYVHHLACKAGEVYKVQRIQATIEMEDFSSDEEEEEEETAKKDTADKKDEAVKKDPVDKGKKQKKEPSWWSSWFRRAPKKYTGPVLVYKIIADFFNTIVQKDMIHPSSPQESAPKEKQHPPSIATSILSNHIKKKTPPTQRLAPNSKSEDDNDVTEEDDDTNMSYLNATTTTTTNPARSRTPSSSSHSSPSAVSRSTPLPVMKSIPEETPLSPKKQPVDVANASYSSSTRHTSTGDVRIDEIRDSSDDDDVDSFSSSSSSSSSDEKPPPKLKAPPRSTLSITKHHRDKKDEKSSTSGTSIVGESTTAKSEPTPNRHQHKRSKSLSGSHSSTSIVVFTAPAKKKDTRKTGKD